MRILTVAVAAALAVGSCAAAFAENSPAVVAKKKRPMIRSKEQFEKCEQLAIDRGVPPGQTGHTSFVSQCMGGPPTNRPT